MYFWNFPFSPIFSLSGPQVWPFLFSSGFLPSQGLCTCYPLTSTGVYNLSSSQNFPSSSLLGYPLTCQATLWRIYFFYYGLLSPLVVSFARKAILKEYNCNCQRFKQAVFVSYDYPATTCFCKSPAKMEGKPVRKLQSRYDLGMVLKPLRLDGSQQANKGSITVGLCLFSLFCALFVFRILVECSVQSCMQSYTYPARNIHIYVQIVLPSTLQMPIHVQTLVQSTGTESYVVPVCGQACLCKIHKYSSQPSMWHIHILQDLRCIYHMYG